MARGSGTSALKTVLVPINRAGYPFIAGFAAITVVLFLIWSPLGWLGTLATAWCIYFFRDPERVVPRRPGLVVAPADGLVSQIKSVKPPADLALGGEERVRISIFLNIFNVHVNRVPVAGTIIRVRYHKGKFLNAAMDKASDENERCGAVVKTPEGLDLAFVQIAGLVARRIVNTLKEGVSVRTGERFGLIRFGSRTDIYLPVGVTPLVIEGQTMLGGETVIADLASDEPGRLGRGL